MNKPAAEFYTKFMGEIRGPFSPSQIRELAQTGRLLPDTHVRKGASGNWVTADRIKGLTFAPKNTAQPVEIKTQSATLKSQTAPPDVKKADRLKYVLAGACCFFFLTTLGMLALFLMNRDDKMPVAVENANTQPRPAARVAVPPKQQPSVTEEPVSKPPAKLDETPKPKVVPKKPSPNDHLVDIARQMKIESLHVKKIGDIELLVGVERSIGYVPKNYEYPMTTGTDVGFKVAFLTSANKIDEPSAGFIPVNGATEQITIVSSDPTVVEVYEDGSAGIRGAGNSTVTFKCAGQSVSIPIRVLATPFNIGYGKSDSKDVIKSLGIPQRKKSYIVSWPDSEIIDQMYYGPDAGSSSVGEHWEYDKLPGLSIRVIGDFVKEIGMRDRPTEYSPKITRH